MEAEKDKRESNSSSASSESGCKVALGIGILIVLMIALCGGVPLLIGTFFFEDSRTIEGDASHYDPIAAYDTVAAYAGDNAQLTGISAYYVRSDGTLDLYADYFPRVDYKFYLLVGDEAGNTIPLGAPNSTANAEQLYQVVEIGVWHPFQTRHLSSSGGTSYSYLHLGMEREIDEARRDRPAEAIPAPACSFADLWALAIAEEDAPANAVANIEYNAEGYRFYINDTDIRLEFDEDCELD